MLTDGVTYLCVHCNTKVPAPESPTASGWCSTCGQLHQSELTIADDDPPDDDRFVWDIPITDAIDDSLSPGDTILEWDGHDLRVYGIVRTRDPSLVLAEPLKNPDFDIGYDGFKHYHRVLLDIEDDPRTVTPTALDEADDDDNPIRYGFFLIPKRDTESIETETGLRLDIPMVKSPGPDGLSRQR